MESDPSDFAAMLQDKDCRAEAVGDFVIENPELIPNLLGTFSSDTARVRFKGAKALSFISKTTPGLLYSHFDFFAGQLSNRNSILLWSVIDIIAQLTRVDSEKKFEPLFDEYFGMLRRGSLITASHIVRSSPTIASAKPALVQKITEEILKLEEFGLPTEECRNILQGHIIQALDQYFSRIEEKGRVMEFVESGLRSSRPSTRKKAERFLARRSE